jgi:hypothetical protein
MIVVVGGRARKVGKTRAVCDIIRSVPEARWVAVKVTSHAHGAELTDAIVYEETVASGDSDTARYLEAGAARALWIRVKPERLAQQLPREGNVIIESNAAADVLAPDLFVFVTDEGSEAKPSADCASRADFTVHRFITPEVIDAVTRRLKG